MKYKIVPFLLLNSFLIMVHAANIAYVPKTAPGNTATAGVGREWPDPRFVVDTTGECVIDRLTGLMWARNASLFGLASWGSSSEEGTAQYLIAQMNTNPGATGYHLCGYSDWRLPNQRELLSLFNYSAPDGNQANWLNDTGVFAENSVRAEYYWSSTSNSIGAWASNMIDGVTTPQGIDGSYSVWPVRGGR